MIDRRKLLKIGSAAGFFGVGVANNAFAANLFEDPKEIPQLPIDFMNYEPEIRRANLYNLHTGENIDLVYKEKGVLINDAFVEVNKVLRDFRNDQTCEMDVKLLDLLDDLSSKLEVKSAFNVISGYRSPATNSMLAEKSNGVAKGSLHMQGKAIDIRVPGVALKHLRNVAKEMRNGGVGYYASSNFVHVDTGRVRYW
ncbi:MAG: DUF882 domain-containing protein [Caulobacterales bacterium]|nr:DUF882 domain-containing protein [Caulobacterales bacterium]